MTAVRIIGAGLAGSEAAWQCARRGVAVELCEMRPVRSTPAHQTADFAELVCSNSLKSDSENTAPWLLKEEMRRAGSLLLEIARECAVPAGHALAVDRTAFAAKVTEAISREPLITVRREEVDGRSMKRQITIIATGPLTSDALAAEIGRLSETANDSDISRTGGARSTHFISTIPSAPSSRPTRSTCRRCTWRPVTTKGRRTTSTVRCRRRNTTASMTRCYRPSRWKSATGRS